MEPNLLNFIHSRFNLIAQSTSTKSSSLTFACLCSVHTVFDPPDTTPTTTSNTMTSDITSSPIATTPSSLSTPNPTTPKQKLKLKECTQGQSDLSRYSSKSSPPAPAPGSHPAPTSCPTPTPIDVIQATTTTSLDKGGAVPGTGMGCGGTIKVTVEDDFSHPLGIGAHRVLVAVVH